MPQIIIVHLELQVIPSMHHLMRHGILLVATIPELVRTQHDAMIDMKASTLLRCAHATMDVVAIELAAELGHLRLEKGDGGRVLEKVIAPRFAGSAEVVALDFVLFGEIGFLEGDVAVASHAGEKNGEGIGPGVVDLIGFGG